MYNIVQAPHPLLRKKLKLVKAMTGKVSKIITEMRETLAKQNSPEGVGLAANQVGIDLQICLVRKNFSKKAKTEEEFMVMINPVIVETSEELMVEAENEHPPLEGCLSLHNYYGRVKRHAWVMVEYQTVGENCQTSAPRAEKFEGMMAVIVQHEIDHLNGKLFVEKVLEQKGALYHLKGKDEKGKDIWEKVALK